VPGAFLDEMRPTDHDAKSGRDADPQRCFDVFSIQDGRHKRS
jgi:hypothetical protein